MQQNQAKYNSDSQTKAEARLLSHSAPVVRAIVETLVSADAILALPCPPTLAIRHVDRQIDTRTQEQVGPAKCLPEPYTQQMK